MVQDALSTDVIPAEAGTQFTGQRWVAIGGAIREQSLGCRQWTHRPILRGTVTWPPPASLW